MPGPDPRGTTLTSWLRLGLALALAAAFAACGDEPDTDEATPPAPAGPTTTQGLPSPFGAVFTQGTAHIELEGGINLAFDVALTANGSVFNPPPAGSSIAYADSAGNAFALGGDFTSGPTSTALALTITTAPPDITLLTSIAGECQVTFDETSAGEVRGSFACDDLPSQGGDDPVDATGTFEAT